MAQFKRALGSDSDGTFVGFDGANWSAIGDAANEFWPLFLGGVLLLLLIVRGDEKAVIPVLGVAVLLQAWQSGLLQ